MPGTGQKDSLSGLLLRLRVRHQRRALDRLLARGTEPSTSPELRRRAEQLAQPEHRRQLAKTLMCLIDAAEESPPHDESPGVYPRMRSAAVLDARSELDALAARLSDRRPAALRGTALASQLIWDDRHSPIFTRPRGRDVSACASDALEAMDEPRLDSGPA